MQTQRLTSFDFFAFLKRAFCWKWKILSYQSFHPSDLWRHCWHAQTCFPAPAANGVCKRISSSKDHTDSYETCRHHASKNDFLQLRVCLQTQNHCEDTYYAVRQLAATQGHQGFIENPQLADSRYVYMVHVHCFSYSYSHLQSGRHL